MDDVLRQAMLATAARDQAEAVKTLVQEVKSLRDEIAEIKAMVTPEAPRKK